jgi:hypothetical protein
MTVAIVIWLVCAAIAGGIGNSKGRAGLGIVLGLVLGLIGVIIIACVPPAKSKVH